MSIIHRLCLLQPLSCILILVILTGCVSPIALNRAVIAYDEAVTDAVSQQLLINIARAHYRQPVHFTGVSNIAATFNFQANAGAIPAPGGACWNIDIADIWWKHRGKPHYQHRSDRRRRFYQTAAYAIFAKQTDLIAASAL